jgi:hypothetical protein
MTEYGHVSKMEDWIHMNDNAIIYWHGMNHRNGTRTTYKHIPPFAAIYIVHLNLFHISDILMNRRFQYYSLSFQNSYRGIPCFFESN